MDHWQQEIFAYFTVLGTSATNATTEALNGIAKLANRLGRGCSFEAVRVKLLYAKRSLETTHSFRSHLAYLDQQDIRVQLDEMLRLIAEYERVSAEIERLMHEDES